MTPAPPPRLAGLDIFRGLAVAGMILVNTPGSGAHVWWPLQHAAWHGFTPADLVFPAFLFAIGTALALSFPRRIDRTAWLRVARRTLLLLLIGWAWQMLARPGIETFRLFGVLPRIALCYGLAAALVMLTARRGHDGRAALNPVAIALVCVGALALYWMLMAWVPVPGHGAGLLTREGNFAGYVDRVTVGPSHMWRFGTDAAGKIAFDPEGLLGTLPALASVLLGVFAALAWQRDATKATRRIALGGALLATAGLVLAPWFPINKSLWTSSYVLIAAGLSAILLALCMALSRRTTLTPLAILGRNAILAYVGSLLIALAAARSGAQAHAFALIEAVAGDPWFASFLYAAAVLLLVLTLLAPLDRRGIYLRL